MIRPIAEPLENRVFFAATPTALSVPFHLTARPWQQLNTSPTAYLDEVQQIARAMSNYQDSSGRIIDPYEEVEVQYSTPYFAYSVGVLASAGRAGSLLSKGVAAMESATATFAQGVDAIPNGAGEFFIAPLTEALALYKPFVPAATYATWQQRMSTPLDDVLRGDETNWRTFAMVGEWERAQAGLVDPNEAISFIESSWTDTQIWRLNDNSLNLYRDYSSDPDSLSVSAVAQGNLLALLHDGYSGPSRVQMETIIDNGTANSLLMQDPTGQAPTSGRASDHTWNDAQSVLNFEIMARNSADAGDVASAGRYRRAAELAFKSIQRWQRADGSYFITKNRFDPSLRVGYQPASDLTNYNGSVMLALAEAYQLRKNAGAAADKISEKGAPAEVGGYAFKTSSDFANAFADAGGMQIQIGLRGSTTVDKGQYWTTLGIDRISRVGWDSRLGPGDGARDNSSDLGVSFAPTFLGSDGLWKRLSSMPDKYTGTFSVQFTSPTLVRAAIDYKPTTTGLGNPTFHEDLVITPDGILSTVTSSAAAGTFGTTWPILVDDGTVNLIDSYTSGTAGAAFSNTGDQESYIALGSKPTINTSDAAVRGSYGDIEPVRMVSASSSNQSFIYPRNASDPTADAVQSSFQVTSGGFSSILGRVSGNLYVGRTSAGGFGSSVDLDGNGSADATFSQPCTFIMQRSATDGSVTKVEADRAVTLTMNGKAFVLTAYTPLTINQPVSSNPHPTTKKELETLKPAAHSDPEAVKADPGASGGGYVRLDADAVNDSITFGLTGLAPGSYQVSIGVRTASSGGILQVLQGDSAATAYTPIGSAHDLYTSGSVFSTINLGTVTVDASGVRYFRFSVAGKSSLSSGYKLSLDWISLTLA